MGHPATEPVDLHHDLLQPGTRRGDQADRPALDRVGEGQRQPADHPGSAVGPHHEQPALTGLPLERHLILDAHVVAEDEGVDVPVQEPVNLRCHVLSGDGHEREVGVAGDAQGALEGACRRHPRSAGRRHLVGQQLVQLRDEGFTHRRVGHIGSDDEVCRSCAFQLGGAQPGIAKDLLVGRRAHHDRDPVNAIDPVQGSAQVHEPERILVRVRPDDRVEHACGCSRVFGMTSLSPPTSRRRETLSALTPATCPRPSRPRSRGGLRRRISRVFLPRGPRHASSRFLPARPDEQLDAAAAPFAEPTKSHAHGSAHWSERSGNHHPAPRGDLGPLTRPPHTREVTGSIPVLPIP